MITNDIIDPRSNDEILNEIDVNNIETENRISLETNNLNLWYGDFQALIDVNARVKSGLITGLIGPSGCGKSALVNMLAGYDMPDTGQILLNELFGK